MSLKKESTNNGHQIVSASGKELAKALKGINPNNLMQSFSFIPEHFVAWLLEETGRKLVTVNPILEDGTLKLFHLKLSKDHDNESVAGKEMIGFYFNIEFEGENFEVNAKCSLEEFNAINEAVKKNPSLLVQVKASQKKEPNDNGTRPIYFQYRPAKKATKKNIAKGKTKVKEVAGESDTI